MRGPRSPFEITLSDEQRAELDAIVAKRRSEQRMVVRARIVLLAAEGASNAAIARGLGIALNTVVKWQKRFFEEGMQGLAERKRSGRPPVFSPLGGHSRQGAGL